MSAEPYLRLAFITGNLLFQIIILIAQSGIFIEGCDHAFIFTILLVLCAITLKKMNDIHHEKLTRMGL
jgi:hypothetical protein